MDPNAALRDGNFAALFEWLRKGGFEPNWSLYKEQTKKYNSYMKRRLKSNPRGRKTRRNPTFYKTFKRSANSLDQMVNARKITVDTGLTEAQARQQCQEFNANRTPAQIRKGLKMEYMSMPSRGNPDRSAVFRESANGGKYLVKQFMSTHAGDKWVIVQEGLTRDEAFNVKSHIDGDRRREFPLQKAKIFGPTKSNPDGPLLKTYGVGTKAFIDTFAGLVPCTVVEVKKPGSGKSVTEGEIVVKITKTVGAYKKGEILTRAASKIVPKSHVVNLRSRTKAQRINTLYRYNPRRKRRTKRRTKRNAPMARAKKIKTGMVVGIAAAAAAVWYFFLRGKSGQLANPLPIVALRDPSRPVGSTGQSYPDREQNRMNAIEAAKYLKPGISDAKAKEIADAMMSSGLMRSFAQRVLSVSEWTNLQPMRNVVENLTR